MSSKLLPYGERAWLVELADGAARRSWHAALNSSQFSSSRPPRGIVEVVPASRTVLVVFRSRLHALAAETHLRSIAAASTRTESPVTSAAAVEIPVIYDGADLAEVSHLLGIDAADVAALHQRQLWFVDFMGFLPGFAYLLPAEPDRRLQVPRRDNPRTRVPAGSIGLAEEFTGLYPQASPGGWQLIGRTTACLWDQHRDAPALLSPGTRVRFVDAIGFDGAEQVDQAASTPPAGGHPSPGPEALTVLDPGAQLLVEDLGRVGNAASAVSGGGAADQGALRRGNRLLGNPEGAAGIESLMGGARLRSLADQWVCVTGAPGPVSVGDRAVGHEDAVWLRAGQELRIGLATLGLRRYLCVRGGVGGLAVLGSRSSDPVSGLGPPPLQPGDAVVAGDAEPTDGVSSGMSLYEPANSRPFGLYPGPRADWFADGLMGLISSEWTVTGEQDRIGLRIDGPALERLRRAELPSEGVLRGAVQVPPSGQPMIFGPDHPTTGGYPVIACVAEADQDRLAQLRPGDRIVFCRA